MLVHNIYDEPDYYKKRHNIDLHSAQLKSWDIDTLEPDVKPHDYVEKCGYVIEWTEQHKIAKQLRHLRFIGDELADPLLQSTPSPPNNDYTTFLTSLYQHNDVTQPTPLYSTLTTEQQQLCDRLMTQMYTVPSWVNWQRVNDGQKLFLRYPIPSLMSLFNMSLIGGTSAPYINKVLLSTNYLNNPNTKTVYKRLVDTTEFVIQWISEPDALKPGHLGWLKCLETRMIHCKVRHRLMNNPHRPWDVERDGLPINVEDNNVTLLAFSINVLLGFEKLGIKVSQYEKDAYIHLWRLIGFYLGIPEEHNPCTSYEHAYVMMGSLLMHSVDPERDVSTALLSNSLLRSTENYRVISVLSRLVDLPHYFHTLIARYMLGEYFSNKLQLPTVHITLQRDGIVAWLRYMFWSTIIPFLFVVFTVFGKLSYIPVLSKYVLRANRWYLHNWVRQQKIGLSGASKAVDPGTFIQN